MEIVPSSQSDEQELVVTITTGKTQQDVKDTVDKWRQEAASPAVPLHDDWGMDMVDADIDAGADIPMPNPDPDIPSSSGGNFLNPSSNHPSPHSSTSHTSEEQICRVPLSSGRGTSSTAPTTPATPLFAALAARPKTPLPDTSNIPLPATPVALDAKSKTDQIIAQIKADALAASASSPDETSKVLEYKDLEDSSSSEEEVGFCGFDIFKNDKKGKKFVFVLALIV